jgi:pimeloyl-ACP methyl ester carboxylesterase
MHARVSTPTGLELSVSDWRGEGHPILFVHGFGNDRQVWEDIAQGLAESERPIAHDLRGHGDSDWSLACDYRADDHADDIAALLDALSLERVRLVGHSLGGNASTLFAAAHPDRVESLVLVDTGPALSVAAWRFAAADAGEMARAYADVGEYRKLLSLAYPLGDSRVLDRLARTSLIQRLDSRFEPKQDPILLALTGSDDELRETEAKLWDALAKVRCPVLVARGARSAMLPEAVARRMVDEVLDRGALIEIPRAGHAVPIDNASDLLAAIQRFVAEND